MTGLIRYVDKYIPGALNLTRFNNEFHLRFYLGLWRFDSTTFESSYALARHLFEWKIRSFLVRRVLTCELYNSVGTFDKLYLLIPSYNKGMRVNLTNIIVIKLIRNHSKKVRIACYKSLPLSLYSMRAEEEKEKKEKKGKRKRGRGWENNKKEI